MFIRKKTLYQTHSLLCEQEYQETFSYEKLNYLATV